MTCNCKAELASIIKECAVYWADHKFNDKANTTATVLHDLAARLSPPPAKVAAAPRPGESEPVPASTPAADERGDWFAKARKAIDPSAPANRIWGIAADMARDAHAAGRAEQKPRRWPEGRPVDGPVGGRIALVWRYGWAETGRGAWCPVLDELLKPGDWWLPQPAPPAADQEAGR